VSVPRNVAKIIQDHVTFELECIDRMYLNVYVPALQCESGVVGFFCRHRGYQFASSSLMDPMTKSFIAATQRFAEDHDVPVIQFQKRQRKDDVMKEQLRHFDKPEGVVFIGKAQEKTPVFPHREAAQRRDRPTLSMDRPLDSDG
jgi:cold shock CspA family protein